MFEAHDSLNVYRKSYRGKKKVICLLSFDLKCLLNRLEQNHSRAKISSKYRFVQYTRFTKCYYKRLRVQQECTLTMTPEITCRDIFLTQSTCYTTMILPVNIRNVCTCSDINFLAEQSISKEWDDNIVLLVKVWREPAERKNVRIKCKRKIASERSYWQNLIKNYRLK